MVRARLGENNTRLTDDPAYMKNYMKAYYQKNFCKAVIQINCPNCGSECTVQKLKRHQGTKLCKRRGDILAGILMEEEMEALRRLEEVQEACYKMPEFKILLNKFIQEKREDDEGGGMDKIQRTL
jgi:hypothetical protein